MSAHSLLHGCAPGPSLIYISNESLKYMSTYGKNWGIKPDEDLLSEMSKSGKTRIRRKGKKFIFRIPLDWMATAADLPGKCVHVGLLLWYESGLTRDRTVKVTRTLLGRLQVKRDAGRRAINRLEAAGLVAVDRGVGRSPLVTIIDIDVEEKVE